MKKILAIVLALALVIVPMTFSVSAEAAATLTVGADKNVEAGEAVAIPVAISGDVVGAQFDIALGDLEYVSCTADAESFTYVGEDNTIKFVDANLDGMSNLFTVNVTIPDDAAAEATYTPVVSNVVVCDINENPLETAVVAGTYTVASSAPAAVLDSTLAYTGVSVDVSDTLGVIFSCKSKPVKAYDHATVEVVMNKYDVDPANMYNQYVAEAFEVPVVAEKISGLTFYNAAFYGIGLAELGLSFTAQIKGYDAAGNFVAYSDVQTFTPAALLKEVVAAAGMSTELRTVCSDLVNLGAEAQARFAVMYPSSDLGKVAKTDYINVGFDQTYATKTLGNLNVVDSNVAVSGSPKFKTLNVAGNIGVAPCLTYFLIDATGTKYDISKLKLEISYTSTRNGNEEITYVADGANGWVATDSTKEATFDGIRLYDGNKTITAKAYYDGALCVTRTYSVDAAVNAYKDDPAVGAVYTAIGKFGASARAFFGCD